MDKIEKIKEWVKKQKKGELARNSIGVITGKALFVDANELLSFLDTLSEESDKGLEEAAEELFETIEIQEHENIFEDTFKKIFIAGAEWQKSQMVKDAVEADVNTYEDLAAGKSWAEFVVEMPISNLGDKARIVVLKAEED